MGEKALLRFLSDRPNIKTVYLCLDSDQAGSDACSRLAEFVPEGLTVHRLIPLFKDWNEVLQHRAEITDGKYLREAIYGLKEPPQEETVEIIRMSEVDTQTVEWLWEPYIPFGKVTIVQGVGQKWSCPRRDCPAQWLLSQREYTASIAIQRSVCQPRSCG